MNSEWIEETQEQERQGRIDWSAQQIMSALLTPVLRPGSSFEEDDVMTLADYWTPSGLARYAYDLADELESARERYMNQRKER